MESESRRLVVAMAAALGVLLLWQFVVARFLPQTQPPAPTTLSQPAVPDTAPPAGVEPVTPATTPAATTPATTAAGGFEFAAIPEAEPVLLGGGAEDALRVDVRARGAAVAGLELFARNKRGEFVHRTRPKVDEPYRLLWPVEDVNSTEFSFATHRIWIDEHNRGYPLRNVVWEVREQSPQHAVLTTTLRATGDGGELLRLTKRYTLRPGKPILDLAVGVENLSGTPLTVRLEQDGPVGIREENPQYDMRRLLTAQLTGTEAELNRAYDWSTLQKATVDPATGFVKLLDDEKGPLAWTALGNKYFAVFTRPVPAPGQARHPIAAATGLVLAPYALVPAGSLIDHGDMVARLVSVPTPLAPGAAATFPFEIYAGPKDADSVRTADPAYASKAVYFQLAQSADQRCACTFLWLEELMVWLLQKIYLVVRNYGVAIIILVIIIRTLLHPLTVWQQKSMFRMQDSMGRIQPKIEAIREKYANDKVKQNQEMMRLWADEGVNPLASMVAFIPLFLQMPILVALWTALNTDVHLRHAPFDGWWIRDLSAPDSLIRFSDPITIPILGWLPLIGGVFSNIASINLLPILMGVSMWLQQKYMPKPDHLKERLEAAKHQPRDPNKPRSGMSPEDQLRQQQIMAYMMSILFPLMFYNMPAGLNLYWMATNVFGICESLIIRKQLREEKKRREASGGGAAPPKKPRQPGPLGRLFRHLAEQAEQVQRRADELAKQDPGRREGKKKS